jgi:hypothetical protein
LTSPKTYNKQLKVEFLVEKLKESELLEGKGEKISKKRTLQWCMLPPYTHLGDVEEIFNPLGVSLGASES